MDRKALVNNLYGFGLTPNTYQARIIPVPYELESAALKGWLDRAGTRWDAFRSRLPTLPGRWLLLLFAGGLVAYAFFLRFLHLLNAGHYYMLSHDSYFFHFYAQGVMAGEPLPFPPGSESTWVLHSGLTYPLAYIANAVHHVFGLPSADALDLVCKFLTPVLGLIIMVVIYMAASRMCGRRVALFSAFAWAIIGPGVFVSTAGYIDRDALSILLIAIGAFLFVMYGSWRFHIGSRDVGWLIAGLGVLAIEGILYVYWSFVGPLLLLAVLVMYFAVKLLLGYFDCLRTEPSIVRRLTRAISEVNWRSFAVVVLANIIVVGLLAILRPGHVTLWLNLVTGVFQDIGGGEGVMGTGIAEMRGININDIVYYFNIFLIPIAVALYLAWRRRSEASIFFACWFLCLLVLSLFAQRILLLAAPAACLLSGVGLAFLWDWQARGQFQPLRKVGVTVLFLWLLVIFSLSAWFLGSSPRLAPHEDWQDALFYLRDDTPQDSVVMTWWDYGYWILDLGQRRPVVDGGYYVFDSERLHDIAVAYTTTDPSEAAEIMTKYGADYLIFSTVDLEIWTAIMERAGLGEEYRGFDTFPEDSMIARSLNGEFDSEGGLEVVYRSAPDSTVVILGSAQCGQPR